MTPSSKRPTKAKSVKASPPKIKKDEASGFLPAYVTVAGTVALHDKTYRGVFELTKENSGDVKLLVSAGVAVVAIGKPHPI